MAIVAYENEESKTYSVIHEKKQGTCVLALVLFNMYVLRHARKLMMKNQT